MRFIPLANHFKECEDSRFCRLLLQEKFVKHMPDF